MCFLFYPLYFLSLRTAFYEETKTEKKHKSSVEKQEKKVSAAKQVAQMHQESHQVSSSYSEEVLEWQKLARKEKSSSVYQEHRLSSVSHEARGIDIC